MSILSSTCSGITGAKKCITGWLDGVGIRGYELKQILDKPYWKIVIRDNNVTLIDFKNESLPDYIVFDEIIGGNFICSYSKLISMKGFPKKVGGNFDISYSKISSLDNVPELVDRDFLAIGNSIKEDDIRQRCHVTGEVYIAKT